ncbi:MAG: hypothetical protein SPG77_03735 [Veillonella caviae]|nr:hypothetical protein [Veillonella caviae]
MQRMIGLSVISMLMIIGSIIGYSYIRNYKTTIESDIVDYQAMIQVKDIYLHSKEKILVDSLINNDDWSESVYQSIGSEPLVVSHSEINNDKLVITLIGTSMSFFAWYNKVNKLVKNCSIRIISINTQGSSIYITCEVKPYIL